MPSESTIIRAAVPRTLRKLLPWALALAVATCADDQNGPSRGGTGYFSFRPVYGISSSLSQFGVVADSVHILLTRPVDQVVLDTTVFSNKSETCAERGRPCSASGRCRMCVTRPLISSDGVLSWLGNRLANRVSPKRWNTSTDC